MMQGIKVTRHIYKGEENIRGLFTVSFSGVVLLYTGTLTNKLHFLWIPWYTALSLETWSTFRPIKINH